MNDTKCMNKFNLFFLTGGICVGKSTLIKRLIDDQALNKDGKRISSIEEPIKYWYKDEERGQLDDIIVLAVVKDKTRAAEFPFQEFFIVTWFFNILVNMIKASIEDKSILIIERDFCDQYSLELKNPDHLDERYGFLEAMKSNFNSYVLLRFVTKLPLLEVMKKNLMIRGTSEVAGLDNPEYRDFVNNYEANFRAISAKMQLGSYPNVMVREYFVDRFLSEVFDEIKFFILLTLAK